jgi:hypothetical protein
MLRVAVRLTGTIEDVGEFLADVTALDAAGADTIWLDDGVADRWVVLGAIATVTARVKLGCPGGDGSAARSRSIDTLQKLSRGRVVVEQPGDEWVSIAMPADRESWAATLLEHEAGGATGVIVAWDPRLIDLLRNPEPEDRSDLLMSTG